MQEQTLNLKWYTFGEKKPEIRILKEDCEDVVRQQDVENEINERINALKGNNLKNRGE